MRKKKQFRLFFFLTFSSLGIGLLAALSEISIIKAIDKRLPNTNKINYFVRPGTITILASNGEILKKLGRTARENINPQEIPLLLTKAFIAAEDRRFYNHNGVDLWGISRALTINLQKRAVLEGGSTITQQLARIIFLNQDQTITRKVKEILLAYKLERQLSKEEILAQYLNNVYLGSNAYGVADAAWIYFSKAPKFLTLAEAALIAGLPPAPSIYSPLVNSDLALKRRSIVLKKMHLEGYISRDELSAALNSPLTLKPAPIKYISSPAPFFTSWVEQKLPEILSKEQLEIGGLTIRTSLNLKWQLKAQEVIRNKNPQDIQGAIVSIEPSSGLVKVLVGGKDFKSTQFNRATQALRSPGSTFKIFPYLVALKKGFQPNDLLYDTPRCWYGYCPKNFGNVYLGEVSISQALTKSLNTIAVDLLEKVGFDSVISMANQLGVGEERQIGKYHPMAIGAYEETVLNMTGAYAAIANRGVYLEPLPFVEITGHDKKIIWSKKLHKQKQRQVVSKKVADTMNLMLQKAVSEGTGTAASMKRREVAGKTGTSEAGRDIWFIGSFPQLTTGVWFGYDNNKTIKSSSGDAALAWKQFMQQIEKGLKISKFPRIKGLKYTP